MSPPQVKNAEMIIANSNIIRMIMLMYFLELPLFKKTKVLMPPMAFTTKAVIAPIKKS